MTRAPEPLNYPGAGATGRSPGQWPAGFRTLRVSSQVGCGEADFALAAEALMTWRLHRAAGVLPRDFVREVPPGTDAQRAAPGVEVVVGLGVGGLRVSAPCRVVWTLEEERRSGWAYGTLPGHPVRGEEAFTVCWDEDGTVRLEVLAFSRPATWPTRAAGPLLPVFQRWYARRCGRVLGRLVRQGRDADRDASRDASRGEQDDRSGGRNGGRSEADQSGTERTEHP